MRWVSNNLVGIPTPDGRADGLLPRAAATLTSQHDGSATVNGRQPPFASVPGVTRGQLEGFSARPEAVWQKWDPENLCRNRIACAFGGRGSPLEPGSVSR